MKKQWILIGTLAVVLMAAGAVFGINRDAGETMQGAILSQTTKADIPPKYWDEVLSIAISPEGWPHDLFIARLADRETLMPRYCDEFQSTFVSPEGWPHELFILQSASLEQ